MEKTLIVIAANKKALITSLIIILFIIPFEETVINKWELKVVDEDGMSMPDVLVTQNWKHGSYSFSWSQDEQLSNQNGIVSFPARSIYLPLIGRIIMPIVNFLRTGFETSYSPYSWLHAMNGKCLAGSASYSGASINYPKYLVLKKIKECDQVNA